MKFFRVACASVLAAGLAFLQQAQASILSYSGLEDAATGSVHAVNDGIGWSNPWDSQSTVAPYSVSDSVPLSYAGLATSPEGNYVNGGNAYTGLGRQLDTGFNGTYDTAGYISDPFSDPDIDQGVLWFSILMRPTNAISEQEVRFVGDSNIAWGPPASGDVTLRNDGSNWGIGIQDGSFTSSEKSVSSTVADLLVARFEMNGSSSSVHLWVNPATLATADPDPSSADAVVTGLDVATIEFRNISFYLGNGIGFGAFDEIRLGTSYASVTPIGVPEPSSILLLLSAAFFLAMRAVRS